MKVAALALASIVMGFLLMMPLGSLFDRMDWPLFHTWGLVHGSFVIAWPVLTLLSFLAIWAFVRFRRIKTEDASRRCVSPMSGSLSAEDRLY